MRKVCLFFATLSFIFLVAASTTAQMRPRMIDNFDLAGGVKVYAPETQKPIAKTQKKPNAPQAVSKTKQVIPIVMTGTSWQQPAARMAYNRSLGSFTTGDPVIDSYITTSSARYNVDPLLIYAQMNQESSFKRRAVSYKGASGLMQLMPATAIRFGVTNIFDPQQNIDAGVKYMRWLLNTFGQDLRLALAGYNAGEGAVMKYGNAIPPYRETQDYVARITARYEQIRNPNFVPNVAKLVKKEVAQLPKNEPPKPVYVPSASVERLPDGRIRLATQ